MGWIGRHEAAGLLPTNVTEGVVLPVALAIPERLDLDLVAEPLGEALDQPDDQRPEPGTMAVVAEHDISSEASVTSNRGA